MGLLEILFGNDNKKDKKKEKKEYKEIYSEEELDYYGLDDNQKEEVRKGNQDAWNFEEEDLEDDDYYNEDND